MDLAVELITAIPFALVGGVIFLIGAFKLIEESRRGKRRALGEVVRVEAIPTKDVDGVTSTIYRPTFRFDTPAGTVERSWTGHAADDWNYPIGTRLPIFYDPADEGYARPAGAGHAHVAPIFFVAVGGAVGGYGLIRLILGWS